MSPMQLRPLGGHIIVEPQEKEAKTASGIYLPDTGDKERSEQGKVVAVGPGKMLENGTRQPIEVKAGDTVVFSYSRQEVTLDGKKFFVVAAEDVMAVIE